MPAYRYYMDADFKAGDQLKLEGAEQHHLAHVMRQVAGDRIDLVNGRGVLASAEILSVGRREALLRVEEATYYSPPKHTIILAQAMTRASRLDFILEKGTELGMSELWLFPAERSEKEKLSDSKLERMRHLTIAAMKQCGRLHLPRIVIREHFNLWDPFDGLVCFGDVDCRKNESLNWREQKRILFFVGPESGFTPTEAQSLRKLGAVGIKLHENILRTETAALTGLALIHWFVQTS